MDKKKQLLLLSLTGAALYSVLGSGKKEKFSAGELEKINKYKKYLEENNYVIVDKNKFKKLKGNKKLLSISTLSSLPKYYGIAKAISKYLLEYVNTRKKLFIC